MQWKLCMGVGLCVPPAHCSRITDGGRNISELFYAFFFFFFLFSRLCHCSDSALLICGRWDQLQQLQEQVFLCIVQSVLQLGTRMSPAPKGHSKMPLGVGAVNDLRVGMEGGDNGQAVSLSTSHGSPLLPSTTLAVRNQLGWHWALDFQSL